MEAHPRDVLLAQLGVSLTHIQHGEWRLLHDSGFIGNGG